jgi:hypothetical protein
MSFETTSTRLWKKLTKEERLEAATHFWKEPPQAFYASALAALVNARRLRPQAARALPADQQARILASILDPGEPLSAYLLVALHLGSRRALLRTFLDAAGLPHDDGVLKAEADDVAVADTTVESAVKTLAAAHPKDQVGVYLNTLWLQDPDRWAALSRAPEWMA